MKRYERMSKEDIIKAVASLDTDFCENHCAEKGTDCSVECEKRLAEWLNEEVSVKKVPRFTTIKTVEEMMEIFKTFAENCEKHPRCVDCRFSEYGNWTSDCFAKFLCEEIEVEECAVFFPCLTERIPSLASRRVNNSDIL